MSRSTSRSSPQAARLPAAAGGPGPGQPRLHGAFRNAEHARGFHEIHLLKVIQDERLAILLRQRQHRASNQCGSLLILQPNERVSALTDRACRVERCGGRGPVAQTRTVGVHRDGGQPGRERGVAPKGPEGAECLDERFLGHVLGHRAIATEAPGQGHQPPLPSMDDTVERDGIAGEDALNGSRVVISRRGWRHRHLRHSPTSFTNLTRGDTSGLHFLGFA